MINFDFTVEDLLAGCAVLRSKDKFSPGFDKMTPDAADTWIRINGEKLCRRLNEAGYDAMPASGFNVAKANGQYRRLARLTAIDSVIQTVIIEKLESFTQSVFSPHSFAYIRGRGTGAALKKFCSYAGSYPYGAKIDPKSCFDNIDFDILEAALKKLNFTMKAAGLLMEFAKMPVIVEGQVLKRDRGIIQGAPVSGLLCNIYFHALDKELESKRIPFIRYADDIVILASSYREAKDACDYIGSFFEKNLALKVNKSKTFVGESEKMVYLGNKFIRDKTGRVVIRSGERGAAVHYEWYQHRPINSARSIDILSDGILRQKDYSALFDTDAAKSVIPLETVDRINIFSSVVFDSGFLDAVSRAGVYVNLFGRDYSFRGRFIPSGALKDQRLIFEQLAAYNNPEQRLQLAKEFDLASVHNLRLNIRYYNKNYPDKAFTSALNRINDLYRRMKETDDYENLLLIEAKIRSAYYGCYDGFLRNDKFVFGERSKRPPLNEVNSMISFGNVVLYNYIATEILKSSLDIRIGYLHASNRRLESLNLDIAEIFRPLIVDRIIFTLINKGEISSDCFESSGDGGIYLNEDGKRILIREFYNKLGTTQMIKDKSFSYAMLIDEEIRKLTRRFRNGEKYKAFRQVR